MAMSLYMAAGKGLLTIPTPQNSTAIISPKRRRFLDIIKSSDDSTAETIEEVSQSSSSSIISALNVERALRGIPITDVDHYRILGLSRQCSYDQVMSAYESKKQELLNNEKLETEELNQKIEMLKESYIILSTPPERRLYDWSLARNEKPDSYIWPFEVDSTRRTPEIPPEIMEPEDFGPTRAVGFFFLGWIVLSIVLSLTINLRQ